MTQDTVTISPGSRFRTAMALAIVADDLLDLGVGTVMVHLLGWHWEFLPSFLAKLVPGVDLVPFWTLAVANVYRKAKRIAVAAEESRQQEQPALGDPQRS